MDEDDASLYAVCSALHGLLTVSVGMLYVISDNVYKEIEDIWNYRANLSHESKMNICPPYGHPFKSLHLHYNFINTLIKIFLMMKKEIYKNKN